MKLVSVYTFLFFIQLSFSQTDSLIYYYKKNDLMRTIDFGERKLKTLKSKNLKFTIDCSLTYGILGDTYKKTKSYELAKLSYLNEIEILIKLVGENNLELGRGYWNLANAYNALGDYQNAESNYLKSIAIKKIVLGEKNTEYLDCLIDFACFYELKKDFGKGQNIFKYALDLSKGTFGEDSFFYQKNLKSYAVFLSMSGNKQEHLELLLKIYNLQKDKATIETFREITSTIDALGFIFSDINPKETEKLFLESLEIKKRFLGTENIEYVKALLNLSRIYNFDDTSARGKENYLECCKILENIDYCNSEEYSRSLEGLSGWYHYEARYQEAEVLQFKKLKIDEILYGKFSEEYLYSLKTLADIFFDKGDFNMAENYYLQTTSNCNNIKSEQCIQNLIATAVFYTKFKIEKSFYFLKQAESMFSYLTEGRKSLVNFFLVRGWFIYYLKKENYKEALSFALKKAEITQNDKNNGELSRNYAKDLMDVAVVYNLTKNYDLRDELYLKVYEIVKKDLGQNPINDIGVLLNMVLLNKRSKNYLKEKEFYLKFKKLFNEKITEKSLEHTYLLCMLIDLQLDADSPLETKVNVQKLLNEHKTNILGVLNFTSYMESDNFVRSQSDVILIPFNFLNKFPTQYPEINIGCYENELLIKNLSLRNQQRISKSIQQSNNIELKERYEQFVSNKRTLTKWNELPLDKKPENFETLTTETESLEKELVRSSSAFAEAKTALSIGWKQIQEKLKPNELAIDLVSFNYYNKKWTDSIVYSAFVVGKNYKAPKYIPLFEEKQLSFLLEKNKHNQDSTRINDQYIQKEISDLFLKPLQEVFKGVKTIYLSPSGLGNQINFSALPTVQNTTFGNQYKVHLLGSTAELVNQKTTFLDNNNQLELLLYGNIDYNKAEVDNLKKQELPQTNDDFVALTRASTTTEKHGFLKGSKQEIENIKALATQHNFTSKIIQDRLATEESIKALDGKTTPFVLHLATHGFFFPNPKKDLPEINAPDQKTHYKTSNDPMMRSGLLFAGADRYWGKPIENLTTEDGIMTANEISNLDLSACQLVVMSACETGLGQINGSEGVFGLQRAFKMAGVKNIIMSLWKVPDTQTAELFDVFYTECFKGLSIHEAFKNAQTKMKTKYTPYYWAGFVLLE